MLDGRAGAAGYPAGAAEVVGVHAVAAVEDAPHGMRLLVVDVAVVQCGLDVPFRRVAETVSGDEASEQVVLVVCGEALGVGGGERCRVEGAVVHAAVCRRRLGDGVVALHGAPEGIVHRAAGDQHHVAAAGAQTFLGLYGLAEAVGYHRRLCHGVAAVVAVDAYAVGVSRGRGVVGVACGVEAVVVVARGVVAVLQRGESRGAEGRAHGCQPPRKVVAAGHGGSARVGHPRGLAETRVVVGGHGLAEGVGDGGGVGVQQAVVGVGVLHALPRVVGGERGGGLRQDITIADSA